MYCCKQFIARVWQLFQHHWINEFMSQRKEIEISIRYKDIKWSNETKKNNSYNIKFVRP